MGTLERSVHSGWAPVEPRVHVLHPGDVALGFQGDRLETLLGSCVAVLLTDPRRTVAAMCHIVHAHSPGGVKSRDAAFAEPAMRELFARLYSVGISPHLCEAHVFGGGDMFPDQSGGLDVGARNLDWVEDFLDRQRIPIRSQVTGGHFYRKVAWTVGPEAPLQSVRSVAINSELH
jgi:chemotaxis protein CheD